MMNRCKDCLDFPGLPITRNELKSRDKSEIFNNLPQNTHLVDFNIFK